MGCWSGSLPSEVTFAVLLDVVCGRLQRLDIGEENVDQNFGAPNVNQNFGAPNVIAS
jgi:hypothetical protein